MRTHACILDLYNSRYPTDWVPGVLVQKLCFVEILKFLETLSNFYGYISVI